MKREMSLLGAMLVVPYLAWEWLLTPAGHGPSIGPGLLARAALVLAGLLPFYPSLRRRWGSGIAAASLLLVVYATQALSIPVGGAGWFRLVAFCLGSWGTLLWWRRAFSDGPLSRAAAMSLGGLAGVVTGFNVVGLALVGLPLGQALCARERRRAHFAAFAWSVTGAAAGAAVMLALGGMPSPMGALSPEQCLYDLWGPQHGLLYWSPLLWVGLLAPLTLLRRERCWAVPHTIAWLTALALACFRQGLGRADALDVGFEPLIATLALGLAEGSAALVASVRRRPARLGVVLVALVVGWNGCFMEQYTRYLIPRDDTVAFDRVVENSAELVTGWVGAPNAWPAVWWFGLHERTGFDRYDPLFAQPVWHGSSAFFEIGEPGVDGGWLEDGWDSGRQRGDAWCRPLKGVGRLLVPVPASVPSGAGVTLSFRAQGQGTLAVAVDGTRIAERPLAETFTAFTVTVAARYWKSPVSHLAFEVAPPGDAAIDWLALEEIPR